MQTQTLPLVFPALLLAQLTLHTCEDPHHDWKLFLLLGFIRLLTNKQQE